jgi:hypothetical protein
VGAVGPGAALKANLIVDLKNMMDGNLVFPVPPDDIIKRRAQPTLELLWESGLSHWNGRRMTGGSTETHLIVLDTNLVFPGPPDDIIKKRAYPTL